MEAKRTARIVVGSATDDKTVVEIHIFSPAYPYIELVVEGPRNGPNLGWMIPKSEFEWLVKQYMAKILFEWGGV